MPFTSLANISNGSSSLGQASPNGRIDTMGKDQFLLLLVAQLKHQDPLNPLESADFTAQLAQFSSVEQLYGMNERLAGIQETLSGRNQQQDLIGLIGKTVKADDNTILIEGGRVVSGTYDLKDSADVTVLVRGQDGDQVRALYLGENEAGEHQVAWDGLDDSGNPVPDGTYYFDVSARDEFGRLVEAGTYISGEVSGLTYRFGKPYLMVGDRLINPDADIVEIRNPASGSTRMGDYLLEEEGA